MSIAVAVVPLLHSTDSSATATGPLARPAARTQPYIAYQLVSNDPADDLHVGLVDVARPKMDVTVLPLRCQRIDVGGGTGLCLIPKASALRAVLEAKILDRTLGVRRTITLGGIPSRARVSPDGRYGAVTAFQTGHSYASPGQFSTSTTLIDLTRGTVLYDVEKLTIFRNGERFHARDFNFWGVTFTRKPGFFYVTLASGARTYLVKVDMRTKRGTVLHTNVECPSLSPDNTRIAFKKRVDDANGRWRLTVLDLRTMRETPLAETSSVDDQAEWLDDSHVLYGLDNEVWKVRADGTGQPELVLEGAQSPSIVRPATSGA
jgi:dipeptidyl aminopeptidase/acylaminoacyl peptidase